jgi:lysophospholipase L1-like esterase
MTDFAKKLFSDRSEGIPTVAFLGDSLTHSCFESREGMPGICDTEHGYPALFKKKCAMIRPFNPINIINAGVGGQTAVQGLARIDRDVISKNPDLVVVCFCLNDALYEEEIYYESLDAIFKRLREAGLETVFMTQSMLNKYISKELQPGELLDFAHKTMEIQLSGKVDRMLDRAVEIAKENGVLVADCHKKWKHLEALGADTTDYLVNHINHPNRQMHWLFADTLFDTVIF